MITLKIWNVSADVVVTSFLVRVSQIGERNKSTKEKTRSHSDFKMFGNVEMSWMDMNDAEEILKDIKKILSVICLSNISSLKKQYLATAKDQRVYDLCTRKTAQEIANEMPDLGYRGVYERVSLWEKNGLIISEEEASGRGRPKKYYIKIERFLE